MSIHKLSYIFIYRLSSEEVLMDSLFDRWFNHLFVSLAVHDQHHSCDYTQNTHLEREKEREREREREKTRERAEYHLPCCTSTPLLLRLYTESPPRERESRMRASRQRAQYHPRCCTYTPPLLRIYTKCPPREREQNAHLEREGRI